MFSPSSGKPFRILALDGGGTFALIQARALDDLYPGESGHEVLSHFDLIAGCSGGAIVAAALIEGYSPRAIFDLFDREENRSALFGKLPWHGRLLSVASGAFRSGYGVGQRFSTAGKLAFLRRILPTTGHLTLEDLHSRLNDSVNAIRARRGEATRPTSFVIVTYDFDRDRARMMRSNADSPAASFPHKAQHATLAQTAHASSTAPINWFDRPAEFDGTRYWDGAMTGYNNPVLAGVVEAIAMGVPREEIAALSLGTSTVFLPISGTPEVAAPLCQPRASTGFFSELIKVGKTIIADPPDAHTFIAHLMLGGGLPDSVDACPFTETPVVRMSPVIQPVIDPERGEWTVPADWSMDDFHRIANMDISATRQDDVELIKRLCEGWLDDCWHNQPIRSCGIWSPPPAHLPVRSAAYLCEIGHRWHGDAKQAWRRLAGE